MMTDLYSIRFHGGCFDGHRQSVNYVPDTRLAIPGALLCPESFPPPTRPVLYELRRSAIELVDGLPIMVLDYYFVGTRVGRMSAAIARLTGRRNRRAQKIL